MNRKVGFLLVAGALSLWSACKKKEQLYTFNIKNDTRDSLKLDFYNVELSSGKTDLHFSMIPGETHLLRTLPSQNQSTDFLQNNMQLFDSLLVFKKGERSFKDFSLRKEWDFKALDESNAEYLLRLDSADFR